MTWKLNETNPTRGLTGLILRLPVYLYRAHLGWLLGRRFILLKHTGRKSGQIHCNVLEVLRYDGARFVVASGWGEKSNWYRNIMKTPDVQIITRSQHLGARAERLPDRESEESLRCYARRYPHAFRMLVKLMLGPDASPDGDPVQLLAEMMPVIALRLKDAASRQVRNSAA